MTAERAPYSPDVAERETLDDGFSKGFGFYFQPNEKYWFDSHVHVRGIDSPVELSDLLDQWFARLDGYRLGKIMALIEDPNAFDACHEVSMNDSRFSWMLWLEPDNPDLDLLKKAIDCGAVGLKIHNKSIICGHHDHEIWLNDAWSDIFGLLERQGLPALWHVTQRKSASPYHGGGVNAYWSEGYERGVQFTNEDLLQVTLQIMKNFPKLRVQGAHQLHIGLDRMSSLLDEYPNLYIDTSCAWYVRWADQLYDHDRVTLRDFAIRYSDRILFGSDALLTPNGIDEYLVQGFLCHPRCILQLRLPHETLQKISHQNAERLYGTETLPGERRGNYRP